MFPISIFLSAIGPIRHNVGQETMQQMIHQLDLSRRPAKQETTAALLSITHKETHPLMKLVPPWPALYSAKPHANPKAIPASTTPTTPEMTIDTATGSTAHL